jgi:hypothetical protein
MEITLYKNHSEKHKIGKNLTGAVEYSGTLRDEASVINPVILIHADNLSQFNYAHIPQFHRYYFIRDIVSVRTGLWRVSMDVDALESFKDGIMNLNVILSDTETTGRNDYLDGDQWRVNVKTKTDIIRFSSGLRENGEYILITAGG